MKNLNNDPIVFVMYEYTTDLAHEKENRMVENPEKTELDEYMEWVNETCYSNIQDYPLVYPALGLAGETGEVVERVKKLARKGPNTVISDQDKDYLCLELGDCLWYITRMTSLLGLTLDEVIERNIEKINARRYASEIENASK